MEHKSYGEQLRGLSLAKRRLRGNLLALHNSLTGGNSQGCWALLPGNRHRMTGNSLKMCQGRFRLDIH